MAGIAASVPDGGSADAVVRVTIRPVEAFDAFYRREFPRLVALARALSGAAGAADDVAQEAMLVAYRRWDDVAHLDAPDAWVRKVCANLACSHRRRAASEVKALVRLAGRRDQVLDDGTRASVSDEFWHEVRRLPRRQAQVVALFYVLDLGVDDVAQTLGVSPGSVKVHLSRARAALAARLGESVDEEPEATS